MNFGEAVTDRRMRLVGMLLHPILHKPELTAPAANGVLTRRVEHPHVVAQSDQLGGEVHSKLPLVVVTVALFVTWPLPPTTRYAPQEPFGPNCM